MLTIDDTDLPMPMAGMKLKSGQPCIGNHVPPAPCLKRADMNRAAHLLNYVADEIDGGAHPHNAERKF